MSEQELLRSEEWYSIRDGALSTIQVNVYRLSDYPDDTELVLSTYAAYLMLSGLEVPEAVQELEDSGEVEVAIVMRYPDVAKVFRARGYELFEVPND